MHEQNRAAVLHRVLEKRATYMVPERPNIWPRIADQLQGQQGRRSWTRAVPHTRLGWVAVGLALFLVLGAAGYTVGTTVGERLFTQLTGRWEEGFKADIVHDVGQNQTIDGVTVTLDRVYILDHQIGIEYTISGLPEPYYYDQDGRYHHFGMPRAATLTDETGRVFPNPLAGGLRGKSEILDAELPPGTALFLHLFDGSAPPVLDGSRVVEHRPEMDVQPGQTELHLRYAVSVVEDISGADSKGKTKHLAGPFTFEFTVPLTGGE